MFLPIEENIKDMEQFIFNAGHELKTPLSVIKSHLQLSLAKKQLQEDDTLLIESDLIFDDSLFGMVIDNANPNLVLVAKYEPWMDGTMVCLNEDNNIINFVSKKNFKYCNVNCSNYIFKCLWK